MEPLTFLDAEFVLFVVGTLSKKCPRLMELPDDGIFHPIFFSGRDTRQ